MPIAQVAVVGAGLAGMCAAHALLAHAHVTVFEARAPAAGASGVAVGLANPFMGRKALPLPERAERLAALDALLQQAGLYREAQGLFRPATTAEQATLFCQRARLYPNALTWLSAAASAERWPDVSAPHGGLWVREGRAVDVAALVGRLSERGQQAGVEMRCGNAGDVARLSEHDATACLTTRDGRQHTVDAVVLCTGEAAWRLGGDVPLHRVKGQIVRLHAPEVAARLPLVAGHGYLVPDGETVLAGSTFEHHFSDHAPTPEGIALLRQQAARLVPALAQAAVVAARAGVRVTAPQRRTLLCPAPGRRRVWVFNALAARGLVTAPHLAASLWKYLHDPASVPPHVGLAGI